jgi:hypothetical protein
MADSEVVSNRTKSSTASRMNVRFSMLAHRVFVRDSVLELCSAPSNKVSWVGCTKSMRLEFEIEISDQMGKEQWSFWLVGWLRNLVLREIEEL